MKYLILNGMYKEDNFIPKIEKRISEEFQKRNITGETLNLHEKGIKACLGCFKCWVQTPGICIINDYGRDVLRKMIQSDYLVYLSPIVYGGYSTELKKAIDRSIGQILPFFQVYHNEIHHVKRYEKYPRLMVIGTLPNTELEQEEIFRELVERNVLNNFAPEHTTTIIYHSDEEEKIKQKLDNGFKIVGDIHE